ncbi:hypothetical protein DVH05_015233 [Phytophthora capsici]|nr:hypothetical protein DVH05_015233 [Phytophthora capsici]
MGAAKKMGAVAGPHANESPAPDRSHVPKTACEPQRTQGDTNTIDANPNTDATKTQTSVNKNNDITGVTECTDPKKSANTDPTPTPAQLPTPEQLPTPARLSTQARVPKRSRPHHDHIDNTDVNTNIDPKVSTGANTSATESTGADTQLQPTISKRYQRQYVHY